MLLGGFGFLSRLYGLSIDNLVEVEMVLADGRIVIINRDEHPGASIYP
jgi:FAD/FMN-containing dehydrogenase